MPTPTTTTRLLTAVNIDPARPVHRRGETRCTPRPPTGCTSHGSRDQIFPPLLTKMGPSSEGPVFVSGTW